MYNDKLIEQLRLLLEQIDLGGCCTLMGFNDNTFSVEVDTVCWTDGKHHYSEYLPEGYHEIGSYLVANVDTGCGQWQTVIFTQANRVDNLEEFDEDEEDED